MAGNMLIGREWQVDVDRKRVAGSVLVGRELQVAC